MCVVVGVIRVGGGGGRGGRDDGIERWNAGIAGI